MLFSAFRLFPLTVGRGGNESFSSKIQPQATMFEYFYRSTLTPSVLLPPHSPFPSMKDGRLFNPLLKSSNSKSDLRQKSLDDFYILPLSLGWIIGLFCNFALEFRTPQA